MVAAQWRPCELSEHVEEVRTRHYELKRLLDERPFDLRILDVLDLYTEAVRDLLDHHDGLHDDTTTVRLIES
jgi:hypothetical protein